MRRPAVLVGILLCALGIARAEARPLHVELRSPTGTPIGVLTGALEDRVAYFALHDVARLVRGAVRGSGDRSRLIVRGKAIEVTRDSPRVLVDGRPMVLSAPVRHRQGTWLVPGELLVKALPAVLGTGIQVAAASPPPPPARPVARPVVTVKAPPRPPAPPPSPAGRVVAALPERPTPTPTPIPAEPVPVPAARAADSAPGVVRAGALELRYRSYPTYTRVVLEGGTPFEPRLVESEGGLVVALAGRSGPTPRAVRIVRDGLVASLELTQSRGAPALRVAFERAPAARKVYRLQDPSRVVLEFYRAAPPGPPAGREALQTIVVDPGHGGHDPGAVGPSGLQEKELTLDVARRLATLAEAELGVKAVLTRSRDQFLALRERTGLANRAKADLFVSIHVNAASGGSAVGTETYFLSSEATDNAARAAAAFENQVIALEPGPRGGSRDVLRAILWDLAQSEFQKESSRLAEALQDNLDRALRLPSRGVKQAPFYVLGGAAMPAVLVEIGFISNPQEEQRLLDEGYRDRIARALLAGLAAYKRRHDAKPGAVAVR